MSNEKEFPVKELITEEEKQYEVENGIIKSPGKFEGEMHYVPQLWDMCLAGEYDDKLPNGDYVLLVDDELCSIGPEIDVDAYAIVLWESEQGFIHADECKLEELKEYCEQWANECDDD